MAYAATGLPPWPSNANPYAFRSSAPFFAGSGRFEVEVLLPPGKHEYKFVVNGDTWLQDNEVYCDWGEFSLFFTELSRAWASVLAQPDAVLGLAPSTGKIGGYRAALIEKIDDWQNDVNEMLADRYDEFEEDGMEARLKCTAGG